MRFQLTIIHDDGHYDLSGISPVEALRLYPKPFIDFLSRCLLLVPDLRHINLEVVGGRPFVASGQLRIF